jgi:hypothetical protein
MRGKVGEIFNEGAMSFILSILILLIGEFITGLLEWGVRSLLGERWFTSETWECLGEVGAVALCVISLGMVRWAYHDWRAITSGVVVSGAALALVMAGGIHWWKLST